jgi:formylglycine-generating enzyme required for sulfatase activity
VPLPTTRTITGEPQQDRDPVTDVTWLEIKTYLDWLSEVTKQRYRLPSGAEWDYAARAGSPDAKIALKEGETVCTYGNTADRSLGSVIWADLSCSDQVGRAVTGVGRYRSNAWGIHDMIGNAWEWTSDCQQPGTGTSCTRYIAKGGSWRTDMRSLKIDIETAVPAGQRRSTLGFRVVREVAD